MPDRSPLDVLGATSPEAARAFKELRRAAAFGFDTELEELVVVGSLAARGQLASMAVHVRRALHHGTDVARLRQAVVATLGASALFGEVVAALRVIDELAEERGTVPPPGGEPSDASLGWRAPATPSIDLGGPLSATVFAPGHPRRVVLLHSLALDRRIWFPLVDVLATRATVVACDLPGHGGSPLPRENTVHAMADSVATLLRTAELGPAVVLGLSLGGSVAQALAIGHGDLVSALALVDTSAFYGPDAPARWAERIDKATTNGMGSLAEFQLERWFSYDFRQRRPDLCSSTLELFRQAQLDGYAAACAALGAMDLRSSLGRIACPTTVVVGERDDATPIAHAERIRAGIPGSTLHVLNGCKHLSAIERPLTVLAKVADLIND